MSTKAIRDALSELSRIKGTTQVQAYQELEAIEKAARAIMTPGVQDEQERIAAYRLLNSIRIETTKT